jgi:hypothetical protein
VTYVFSYYARVRTPVLVRRPWWNLFGKDRIEFVEHRNRKSRHDLTEAEAKLIMDASANYWNTPAGSLLIKLLDEPSMHGIQLAHGATASEYVSVGVVS